LNREWLPGRSARIGFPSISVRKRAFSERPAYGEKVGRLDGGQVNGTALRRGRGKVARFTLEWEEATASAQPGDKLNDSASDLGAVFDVLD
jgi:hypothetical protein